MNAQNWITKTERTAGGRINTRGKGGVISDCRVSFGIIDEGDNNDTRVEEEKKPRFSVLNESEWSLYKISQGSFYLCSSAAA